MGNAFAMHIAFALAIFVALGAVGLRAVQKRRRRYFFHALPGHNPDEPRPVTSYKDAIAYADKTDCYCGAPLFLQGERTQRDGTFVVVMECQRCEDVRRFYFDVSGVPN